MQQNNILRYCTQIDPGYVLLKFVQKVTPPTLLAKITAKDNLNISNLMQNFENLSLRKYSTEFFDTAYKQSLGMCN